MKSEEPRDKMTAKRGADMKAMTKFSLLLIAVYGVTRLLSAGSLKQIPPKSALGLGSDACPYTRFCTVDGCFERGTEAVVSASGGLQYYCPTHVKSMSKVQNSTVS